ncbi:bacterial extracellular solute-binding s, 5 Middle family protein, partial [Chlamydia psittaci 84-8471/1]
ATCKNLLSSPQSI